MKHQLNRRDFLKLASALPLGMAAPRLMRRLSSSQQLLDEKRNVLVIVFDAFSAYHLSLHGYQRETMPNLVRLAERAIVYHNHYAGGSFTTTGTASLLTGTLPWTHRAFQPKATVDESFVNRNIFSAFRDYYRIAYTHNGWAEVYLHQFRDELDEMLPWRGLFLRSYGRFVPALFENDSDIASVSWTRNTNVAREGYSYSLFLSHLYEALRKNQFTDLRLQFPRGLPATGIRGGDDNSYLLETAVDWVNSRLPLIPRPFLGYFHFFPPHDPYHTPIEFFDRFKFDDYRPINKPFDIFTEGISYNALLKRRNEYDEFILYVDREFDRLFNSLESSGLLDDTWVIFTSDHGEVFERGSRGHDSDALYQPQIRVPLLIFEPGRRSRLDIHTPTNAIDLLPTLAHITGHGIPDWADGILLPPFETSPDPNRNIYVMKASKNDKYAPIAHASMALIKGRHKLLYYIGDVEREITEMAKLYDIEADPEELFDLYPSQKDIAMALVDELKAKLAEVNKPYL